MRPARVERIEVSTTQEIDTAVLSYVTQGYVLLRRTPTSAVVQKKKDFEVAWVIVGLFLCLVPLVIYLLYYLFLQPAAEVREIVVVGA